MKLVAVLVLSLAVVAVFVGMFFITAAQLDDLPANPIAVQLKSERENLEEIKGLILIGLTLSIGVAATASGILLWKNLRSR